MDPAYSSYLSKYIQDLSLLGNSVELSEEQASRIEWFLKDVAVHAVNDENKKEFLEIINSNDILKLAPFIEKNVPDFKDKFSNFINGF